MSDDPPTPDQDAPAPEAPAPALEMAVPVSEARSSASEEEAFVQSGTARVRDHLSRQAFRATPSFEDLIAATEGVFRHLWAAGQSDKAPADALAPRPKPNW